MTPPGSLLPDRPLPPEGDGLRPARKAEVPIAPAGVTIVVLNWNNCDDTLACLESLAAARLDGARMLVVDNGSRDGSVDAIRTRFAGVRLVALAENRGFAGGSNAGIRPALEDGADAVLLLNNDTRVLPDFLGPLVQAMNDSSEAAAVTGAIMRLDRPDMLDVAYAEVRLGERHAVQLRGVNALAGHGFDTRRMVEVATGCCLLLRGEALRDVGLFDEAYFAYHEDVDWCFRARRAGWTVLYEPFARVLHRGSGSTRRTDRPTPPAGDDPELPNAELLPWNPVRTYLGARNLVRLVREYANRRQRIDFVVACVREIPLELLALVMGREGWLRLGRFGWKDAWRFYLIDRRRPLALRGRPLPPLHRVLLVVTVPFDLLVALPLAVVSAARKGRLAELCQYVRGLIDGALNRRLPLERLGLR